MSSTFPFGKNPLTELRMKPHSGVGSVFPQRTGRRVLLEQVGCGLLLLTGCASLKPAPFRGFEAAVSVSQRSLETEMSRDVYWTREADVQDLADAIAAPLSAHTMKEAKEYAWTMESLPPHWEARRTLRTLEELNAAFRAYVSLLTNAAEGELKDESTFDGFAENLNDTLRDLKGSLSELKTTDKAPVAGISALSTESLRRFVAAGRARDLGKSLRENQPLVEAYAAHCRGLIILIRADLKAAYAGQVQKIHEKWDDKRSPGRMSLTRTLFNLNEEYAGAMESLQALEVFYNNLPAAHVDLARTVDRSRTPRKALAALTDSATRSARLARDLEKSR